MSFKPGTHFKIAFSWVVCIAGGISLFILSKNSVDKKRYENMKIRQRMLADINEMENNTSKSN